MRLIVAICGRKGGVGKSSVALNLAHALQLRGQAVQLFDLDPQANLAYSIAGRSDLPPVRAVGPGVRLERELPREGIAVIDTPPGTTDALVEAVGLAELVILPIPPSLLAVVNAAGLVDQLQAAARPPAFRFLLNMVDDGAACRAVEEELRRVYPKNIMRTAWPRSAWFERSLMTSRTVLEAAPRSRAADAIRRTAGEVLRYGK